MMLACAGLSVFSAGEAWTACPTGCKTCSGTTCKTCRPGYYLDGSRCKQCSKSCKTCKSFYDCQSCNKDYYLSGKSCKPVPSTCSEWDSKNNKCKTCKSSYVLRVDGTCNSSCGKGYYKNGSTCYTCSDKYSVANGTCTACDASKCTSCTCESGYYNAGWHCDSCSHVKDHCATCGQTADGPYCVSCDSGYVLKYVQYYGYQCRPESEGCNNGEYNKNGSCVTCSSKYGNDCSACDKDKCTKRECGLGDYYDAENDSCATCSSKFANCASCSSNSCYACADGYLMKDGVCVSESECGDGWFKQSSTKQCKQCTSGCTTCDNETGYCNTCDEGKSLVEGSDGSRSCQDGTECRTVSGGTRDWHGDYAQFKDGNVCKICSDYMSNCLECSSSNECTKCDEYEGYYLKDGHCEPCWEASSSCRTCTSADVCTSCNDVDQVLKNGECLPVGSSCGAGYYKVQGYRHTNDYNGQTECKKCPDNCDSCSSSTTCNTCAGGYVKNESGACEQMPGCL